MGIAKGQSESLASLACKTVRKRVCSLTPEAKKSKKHKEKDRKLEPTILKPFLAPNLLFPVAIESLMLTMSD